MTLNFKEITAQDMPILAPYYTMRPNRTCDSVFLESFIWKDFYNVRYALWENRAVLWLMENNGKYFFRNASVQGRRFCRRPLRPLKLISMRSLSTP